MTLLHFDDDASLVDQSNLFPHSIPLLKRESLPVYPKDHKDADVKG